MAFKLEYKLADPTLKRIKRKGVSMARQNASPARSTYGVGKLHMWMQPYPGIFTKRLFLLFKPPDVLITKGAT